jgi:hypothetical protein
MRDDERAVTKAMSMMFEEYACTKGGLPLARASAAEHTWM